MFQFCRLCMVPQKFANLSSLNDGDGSKALMFKQIFDIDVRIAVLQITINFSKFDLSDQHRSHRKK